ncbi:MAG: hypothetical protein ACT4OX_02695 [Actinomycetota bacterium]
MWGKLSELVRRLALLAVAASVALPVVRLASPAAAGVCLARAPQTAAEYQAVADARSSSFGAGDLTTMVQLPDGRRLFVFGDTAYAQVNGNVYAFGDARYFGNAPWPSDSAIVGLSVVPGGYRMIDMKGRVIHRGASTGAPSVPTARARPLSPSPLNARCVDRP